MLLADTVLLEIAGILAREWSVEDEEEQKRERRRRDRQLSSASEAKEEASCAAQNATSQVANRLSSSSDAKPSKLESSKLENERTLEDILNKQEDQKVKRQVAILNNAKQDTKKTLGARKLEKETVGEKVKSSSELPQEQKNPGVGKCEVQVQQKGRAEGKHLSLGQERETTTVKKHENLNKEEKSTDEVFSDEQKAPNTHESQRLAAVQDEVATQTPEKRKSISRLEVKIQSRVKNFSEAAAATSSSVPQATERSTSSPRDGSASPLQISHPVITYGSSLKRASPRTISFRVVPRKDKEEDKLHRSASMRLPACSATLEEKREKYTSAVQRSGSIKLSPSAWKNFQPSSEGVASKRSIFETNVRAEPTTLIRKESFKIPGGVSSRINLWISRTQEPSKDEGVKNIRRTENTSQRSQWEKQSNDS
ncbi:ladinin-1 [Varanus komodoensis]|uniref:ladinin-1 n=1 Tax=Varanus komodoensis TaxID=61221 RepID=UPI001CF77A5E|nr:ladinin-1 [Varanus komodoensis]